MNVLLTKKFKASYKKRILPFKNLDKKFEARYDLFTVNSNSPLIRDHKLKGATKGYRAFSVTGDIRIIYYVKNNIAYFVDIGTHNQVY